MSILFHKRSSYLDKLFLSSVQWNEIVCERGNERKAETMSALYAPWGRPHQHQVPSTLTHLYIISLWGMIAWFANSTTTMKGYTLNLTMYLIGSHMSFHHIITFSL